MDLGLDGRVYIVTGGTRGLGHAVAQALVAEGARVVLSGRSDESTHDAAAALGGREVALGVAGNLDDPGTGARLVATARARWDRLDGALVSSGGPPPGAAAAVTDEVWRASFEQVFLGPLRVARAVAAECGPDGGSIVIVLSSSVREPVRGLDVSNGLRPGLAMVAKSLADELGASGIRVNGLLPGRIDTERVREVDAAAARPATARRETVARIPLGRYGDPAEFGRVGAFLLSPAASYLTGAMVPVDGGLNRGL